jgi:hypothetical protein
VGASLAERIREQVPQTANLYHRLILAVGPPRTGKTTALQELAKTEGWPLINVNLRLSELLLELTHKQRTLRVPRLLADLLPDLLSEVVVLDNIELLFSPELSQDPLRLLQGLSRNRTIIATWAGDLQDAQLTYAEPGHPEERRYAQPDAICIRADGEPAPAEKDGKPDVQSGSQETR